ncbi:hypothetical protein B0H14DRAFT_2930185 [Mycena olivaceomarginata]|nr:hypothetical protein B0H14DRAFT_2930185 [Mycena olivaceomarginata]
MNLLKDLDNDLADLTPRRLLRHPVVQAFLTQKLPSVINPTLADWHVSLANRSHLKAYIRQARELHYPFGTSWAGVVYLKARQDEQLPKEKHYIRRVLAIEMDPSHEDDDDDEIREIAKDGRLRIIICMTPEASRRLISSGRYLQSDIAFRRIVGFKEFEVAGMERDANTIFEEIEDIVYEDTGRRLRWHHLHASSPEDGLDTMILSWVADQHRGQAKGLGLHLQKIASKMPPKRDLYQTDRYIQDLSPYEHLHRNFRVCVVHYFRLVKLCSTTEHVRWLMRSLVCMEHADWEGTLQTIRDLGGKAAQDWLQNKLSSGFVFEGICWEKSFIPRAIWEAGDNNSNLIETVHRDANREGVHCTLVGGLKRGQLFDSMKMKSLGVFEDFGITPTYKTGHTSENALSNLKRRDDLKHKQLVSEDEKIHVWNRKLEGCLAAVEKAQRSLGAKLRQIQTESDPTRRQKIQDDIVKKRKAEAKAFESLDRVWGAREDFTKIGSGRVALLTLV